VIAGGFKLAAAGAVIGIFQPFVRSFVGQYVGASPIASAGITLGTAYALSFVAKFIPFTRKYEDDILLAGATIAAAQLISAYVQPYLKIGNNPLMSGPRYGVRRGMRGIAAVHGIPPQIVPPPLPPQGQMNGLAMRPGVYAR
jgi:hypothetical protein